jgi:hypothetical protein
MTINNIQPNKLYKCPETEGYFFMIKFLKEGSVSFLSEDLCYKDWLVLCSTGIVQHHFYEDIKYEEIT